MISKILYNLSVALGYKEPKRPTYETFPKQTSWGRVTAQEVRTILENNTGIELKTSFNNADASYKRVDIDNLKLFVAKNNLSKLVYEKEILDCDDFSFILQGDVSRYDSDLAFGIVWGVTPQGQGHSWNWCIGTEGELWFIDPQQNRVFKPEKLWKITLLIM
jgi:hypothetical protein